MKWAGILLVIVSLSAGSLAAACAYHVPLSLPDNYFKDNNGNDLTLKTVAGVVLIKEEATLKRKQQDHARLLQIKAAFTPTIAGLSARELSSGLLVWNDGNSKTRVGKALSLARVPSDQILAAKIDWLHGEEKEGLVLVRHGTPVPLVQPKTKLTSKLLAELRRQARIPDPRISRRYVVVREFYWAEPPYSWLNLWPYNWLFLLSVLGLLGGAVLLRISAKKAIAAAGEFHFEEGPQAALEGIGQILEELRCDVGSLNLEDVTGLTNSQKQVRMQTIIQKLDEAQRSHMPAFIDARPQLVARFGMDGYAKLMDSYAACERQIHRAWSAAADDVYEESVECLDAAAELLRETMEKMKGNGE